MNKIKIGVLCPSEIAFRRFLPALQQSPDFEYVGVAVAEAGEWFGEPTLEQVVAEQTKAQKFVDSFGGRIFAGYEVLLNDPEVGAVYIPLPPALHYEWAKKALRKLRSMVRRLNLPLRQIRLFLIYRTAPICLLRTIWIMSISARTIRSTEPSIIPCRTRRAKFLFPMCPPASCRSLWM